jgi:hypothetical protein
MLFAMSSIVEEVDYLCACGCEVTVDVDANSSRCDQCGCYALTECMDPACNQSCNQCGQVFADMRTTFDKYKNEDSFKRKLGKSTEVLKYLESDIAPISFNYEEEVHYGGLQKTTSTVITKNTTISLKEMAKFFIEYGTSHIPDNKTTVTPSFDPWKITKYVMQSSRFETMMFTSQNWQFWIIQFQLKHFFEHGRMMVTPSTKRIIEILFLLCDDIMQS